MTARTKPSHLSSDPVPYPCKAGIDYRRPSRLYRAGKGEQGVLICEPYKSELALLWRFETQPVARRSAAVIHKLSKTYLDNDELVGADLARKFLQMGHTRARRYANSKGGRKYKKTADFAPLPQGTSDAEKAECAANFYHACKRAEAEPRYAARKTAWKAKYG